MNRPEVSLILPVRNEGGTISRTLEAVARQDYDGRMEVLVVDGESRDDTRSRAGDLMDRLDLTILDNPGLTAASGLNRGIRRAMGEIILRIDGHTEIAPDYVSRTVAALETSGADIVGGPMTAHADGGIASAIAWSWRSGFGAGPARFRRPRGVEEVDTVYLGAWRRELPRQHGLFDESQVRNQDDEFAHRVRAGGGRVVLDPRISSRYRPRASLSALFGQFFAYGRYKPAVMRKHGRRGNVRSLVPVVFVLIVVGVMIATIAAPETGTVVGAAIAICYAVSAVVSAFRVGARGVGDLLLQPIVAVVQHVGYGLGFMWGLVTRPGLPAAVPSFEPAAGEPR